MSKAIASIKTTAGFNTEKLNGLVNRIKNSSENIKVELQEMNPEPDKKELGVLKWNINLSNLEDKVIQYRYFVDYKKGIIITPSLP